MEQFLKDLLAAIQAVQELRAQAIATGQYWY